MWKNPAVCFPERLGKLRKLSRRECFSCLCSAAFRVWLWVRMESLLHFLQNHSSDNRLLQLEGTISSSYFFINNSFFPPPVFYRTAVVGGGVSGGKLNQYREQTQRKPDLITKYQSPQFVGGKSLKRTRHREKLTGYFYMEGGGDKGGRGGRGKKTGGSL